MNARIALLGCALGLSLLLAGSPASADGLVGAGIAGGTGVVPAGAATETLEVAAARKWSAGEAKGYVIYTKGTYSLLVQIQCGSWSYSSPSTSLYARGVGSDGKTYYVTVRDSGPGGVADFFALTYVPNTSNQFCQAPESGFKAVPGGPFVVTFF